MIKMTYHFKFTDPSTESISFSFGLDEDDFSFISNEAENPEAEDWAKLGHKQCSNCPLSPEEHPYCPVAKNLGHLVYFFKDTVSHSKSKIFVEGPDRAYAIDGTIQEGLFSIFGVIMATSSCPHLDFFRPMARFHLPFASQEETLFRVTSAYLLKKYLKNQAEGQNNPIDLTGLTEIYKEVEIVNKDFIERIRSITKKDAELNAVVILNCFAQKFDIEMSGKMESLYPLFQIKKKS